MRSIFIATLFLVFSGNIFSQDSSSFFTPVAEFNKPRFVSAVGVQAAGYGGSLALLSYAWYNDYNQTSFHSFDDSPEWLQMDKAGHVITSWYLANIGTDMMEWSGVGRNKAIWYGAGGSFLYLTGIELLDGFSEGWGFSWSDISANTIGTGIMIGQKCLQNRPGNSLFKKGLAGISLKFSFSQSPYAKYRPVILGNTLAENILKDYNGQTYWLSINFTSFMKKESKFPKWLNLAIGYGGEGMISGKSGYAYVNEQGNTINFVRYRQYYFSLDIDLTKIKTRSPFLKTIFELFSFIKIPTPALEMNKYGLRFHPIHY